MPYPESYSPKHFLEVAAYHIYKNKFVNIKQTWFYTHKRVYIWAYIYIAYIPPWNQTRNDRIRNRVLFYSNHSYYIYTFIRYNPTIPMVKNFKSLHDYQSRSSWSDVICLLFSNREGEFESPSPYLKISKVSMINDLFIIFFFYERSKFFYPYWPKYFMHLLYWYLSEFKKKFKNIKYLSD